MRKILSALFIAGVFCGCSKKLDSQQTPVTYTPPTTTTTADNLSYLALGDSYTIGEAVELNKSFPYQLAASLNASKRLVTSPKIIATTGWTTGDLIQAVNTSDTKGKKYDIVTLLIGVNNQYRGYSKDTYRAEFIQLLNTAIAYANGNKAKVFVLSIPDWGATPFANGQDRAKISADIAAFNSINKAETEKQGVAYIDITFISTKASTDATLTAGDGLHPSAGMYSLWVQALSQVVLSHL